MSTSVPIIITVPTKPTNQESLTETQESIYDAARAIINEAEYNNTPIWIRTDDENPVD